MPYGSHIKVAASVSLPAASGLSWTPESLVSAKVAWGWVALVPPYLRPLQLCPNTSAPPCSLLPAPGTPVGPGPSPREAGEGCPALLVSGPGEPRHLLSPSSVPFRSLLWALFVPRMFVLGPEALYSLVGLALSRGSPSCCEPRPARCGPAPWTSVASRLRPLPGGASASLAVGSARW